MAAPQACAGSALVQKLSRPLLVAEAGLGKSRLLFEFENWLCSQSHSLQLYRGRARLETRGQAYGLLRNVFASQFEIHDDEPLESVRSNIARALGPVLGAMRAQKDWPSLRWAGKHHPDPKAREAILEVLRAEAK